MRRGRKMKRAIRRIVMGVVAVAIALSLTPAGAIPPPIYGGSCHEGQSCVCITSYAIQRNRGNKTQPVEIGVHDTRCFDPPGH
jgi:hypothetical protein